MARLWSILSHTLIILLLTALTQIGGIAWLLALRVRRWRLVAFAAAYAGLWMAAVSLAPLQGRVPLPCHGETLQMQSPLYCVMLRHFVTPELAEVAHDIAADVAAAHPGTVTLALDGSFPFLDGMPLLPHLSHHDGRKLDFAFFYTDDAGKYLPGKTRSPIGYFAFELPGDPVCPPARLTLRWQFAWLQPLWPDRPLNAARTETLLRATLSHPKLDRLFLEPPLAAQLGVQAHPKLRFQGCRAARHDDHIHMQI